MLESFITGVIVGEDVLGGCYTIHSDEGEELRALGIDARGFEKAGETVIFDDFDRAYGRRRIMIGDKIVFRGVRNGIIRKWGFLDEAINPNEVYLAYEEREGELRCVGKGSPQYWLIHRPIARETHENKLSFMRLVDGEPVVWDDPRKILQQQALCM